MTTQIPLTDDTIRAAITRRATGGDAGDLRDRVLAATSGIAQRPGWRARVEQLLVLRQRRATLTIVVGLALLLATAVVVALVGSQINRPTPGSLGRLAYLSEGDVYVAEPDGTSGRLIWDLPPTEDLAPRQLVWLDPETVLLHNYSATAGGVSVLDVASGAHRLLDTGDLVALSPTRKQVATLGYEEGATPPERLRILDIASGAVVAEFATPIRAYPHNWSPDGRWLLGEMPESIYKVDTTNGAITTLATGLCCGLSLHSPHIHAALGLVQPGQRGR